MPKEYRVDGMPAEIEALWADGVAWLKDAGCEIVEVSLPHTQYALPAYYIIAPAEASSNLARYDGMRYGLRVEGPTLTDVYEETRAAGFGEEVQAADPDRHLCALGRLLRRLLPEGARRCAGGSPTTSTRRSSSVDALLTPTAPSAAFGLGDERSRSGGHVPERHLHRDGEPGRPAGDQRPGGLDEAGLPLGLQLIGRALDEGTVFSLAAALEKAAAFRARPQSLVDGLNHFSVWRRRSPSESLLTWRRPAGPAGTWKCRAGSCP